MIISLSLSFLLAADLSGMEPVPQPGVVVTAARIAQSVHEAEASVTLITRAEIEASNAAGLIGLLRLQAGVEFSRNGGLGHQTSLFLRGTESNHVLVLIDGVRANSVQTGAFSWAHMLLSQVERIEIVRGPAAAFYGSEAIGGVIQIFTRHPSDPVVHAEIGSYDTRAVSAGFGGGDELRYHLNVSHRQSDGFSAQSPAGFFFNPDDDGYENTSFSGGLSAPIAQGLVTLDAWHADGEVEFDQGLTDTINRSINARWRAANHDISLGRAYSELETAVFDSGFESQRLSFDWQYRLPIEAMDITTGLNYTHEEGESYSLATASTRFEGRRDNFGVFAALQYPMGDWEADVALRVDDNSEFGTHSTGKAALAWQISDAGRAWASYGTGFRAPNFSELFSPGFGGLFAGNPALEPETSNSWELAFEQEFGTNNRLTLNLYRTRIDDLIAFQGVDFQAININEASITGFETRYDWHNANWNLGAALTLQDTEDESTGESLLRRADEKLAVTLDRKLAGQGNVGVELIYHGERLDVASATLDAYTLVNLRMNWPLNDSWTLTGRVENLLDKDYALTAGFNTADLSVYAGFTWRP